MSWLPQRWRTQRNAIRHANCKNQWVIKILNAPCTSLGEYVCWSVCSSPPTLPSSKKKRVSGCGRPLVTKRTQMKNKPISRSFLTFISAPAGWDWHRRTRRRIMPILMAEIESCQNTPLSRTTTIGVQRRYNPFRTSNQARIPAEFKHITKRRKRN